MSQHVRLFRISIPSTNKPSKPIKQNKPKVVPVIVRLSVTREQIAKSMNNYKQSCTEIVKHEETSSRREKLMSKRLVYRVSKLMPNHGENWPDKSPYKCFRCHNFFQCKPKGIPEKIQNNEIFMYANFCSFNCAHNYLYSGGEPDIDQCTFDELQERKQLLSWVELQETGEIKIMRKISFHMLEDYGGNKTVGQLRDEKFAGLNRSCTIEKLPIRTVHFRIVEEQA